MKGQIYETSRWRPGEAKEIGARGKTRGEARPHRRPGQLYICDMRLRVSNLRFIEVNPVGSMISQTARLPAKAPPRVRDSAAGAVRSAVTGHCGVQFLGLS